jgi:predicted RNase H-like HicB family nuclease
MLGYPMIVMPLSAEDGGGFEAIFPDLPDCACDGETPEEAVSGAVALAREWTRAMAERGAPVPTPFSAADALQGRDEQLLGALRTVMEYTDAVEARIGRLEAQLDEALARNGDDWARVLPLLAHARGTRTRPRLRVHAGG